MNSTLMKDYIEKIIKPYFDGKKGLLILDSFKAHYKDDVMKTFTANNIVPILIPGGYTSLVQPLDIW